MLLNGATMIPTTADIKSAALRAGHPVLSVKTGRGSLSGRISVHFTNPLPSGEAMSLASRWLRQTFPTVEFSGDVKPEGFCVYHIEGEDAWRAFMAADQAARLAASVVR